HNLVGVYFCYSNNTLISNCTLVNGGTGIICGHYSSRNVILNCYVMDNSEGIALSPESSNTTLVDCNILNGYAGIDISSSSNNTILKCNILNATFGIDLSLSCNNIISDCNLSSGYEGILLADCSNNTILYSSISNYTCRGFELVHSSNNTIDSCIISNNQLGIELRSYSNNNSIRHNNFINNTLNGYDTCSNYWDDGSEGNHWSDYNGTDANNDRIGDTPYNIPGGVNKDNYPLMYPWGAIPPIANFTFLPSLPTAIDRIEFNGALSKDLDGAIACWLWSFGDSTNSTLQNPTHKYPKRGSYQVKLTVWDNDGANHTTTKTIIILNSQPILSNITLSPKTGTPDTEFTFRITYSDADGDEPLYMRIVIDNVPYDMTKVEGDYVTGVVYEYKTKLSAGLHRYKFECDDGSGEVTSFVSTSVESLSVEEKPIPYLILISTVVVLIIIGVLLAVWLRKKKSKIP
ncbi:MAG: NosD domain-containing protein, partial [Candidatus Thermoplasmatota archaeon]